MASKASASFLFLLVANLIATQDGVSAADTEPTCFSMTAAMTTGNTFFFFYGSNYIAFDSSTLEETHKGLVSDYFQDLPNEFPIDAAFAPVDSPDDIILISGGSYITFSSSGERDADVLPLSDMFPRGKKFSQGIDAAVTYKDEEYFFKRCTLAVKKEGKVSIFRMKELGLPCFIDAAWVNGNRIIISKGPSIWRMKGTKKINVKPHCFADSLKTEVNICRCS